MSANDSFHMTRIRRIFGGISVLGILTIGNAHAAEGFVVRYNIAGSLGGEIFAAPDSPGVIVGTAYTYVDIKGISGNNGKDLKTATPAGTVALPSPIPAALYPTYKANVVNIEANGTLQMANLVAVYTTKRKIYDGRMNFGINIPYGVKKQTFVGSASTPALNWPSSAVPSAAVKAAVAKQFDASYQSALAAQSDPPTGKVDGLGDVELWGGWFRQTEKFKWLVGGSVILPTGQYNTSGLTIGNGNFYTFRPVVQVVYQPQPKIALATKVTFGFNTKNKDNDLRSGNWGAIEAAAGYMTKLGVIGAHAVYVKQFQDDKNNPWGASRFESTNLGAFFTTRIPGMKDAGITAQYMHTIDSKNAKYGDFYQIRFVKRFSS